jgi:hypothetical protein
MNISELSTPFQEAERRAHERARRITEWVLRAAERGPDSFGALLWADDWVRLAEHACIEPRNMKAIQRRFKKMDPDERRSVLESFLWDAPDIG